MSTKAHCPLPNAGGIQMKLVLFHFLHLTQRCSGVQGGANQRKDLLRLEVLTEMHVL